MAVSVAGNAATSATTDPLVLINQLRSKDCRNAVSSPLVSNSQLQAFAGLLAKGVNRTEAERRSGYLLKQSTLLRISGASATGGNGPTLREVLRTNYCTTLTAPEWQQVAVIQQQQNWWIVLATPHELPTPAAAEEVLVLVNQARKQSRRCGAQLFAAAPTLQLNNQLIAAAQQHANDMAQHGFMEHRGSDGSTADQRLTQQGYRWASVGENIAAGPGTAAEVVAGWLASPGHCANLMDARFTQMGLAFAINRQDEFAVYWAQTFAVPK